MLPLQPGLYAVDGLSCAIRSAIHPPGGDRTGTGTRTGLAAGEPEGEGWGVRPLCGVCFLANPRSSRTLARTPWYLLSARRAGGVSFLSLTAPSGNSINFPGSRCIMAHGRAGDLQLGLRLLVPPLRPRPSRLSSGRRPPPRPGPVARRRHGGGRCHGG